MDMRIFSVNKLEDIARRIRIEGSFVLSGDDIYLIEEAISIIEDLREEVSRLKYEVDDMSSELSAVCFRLQEMRNEALSTENK